MQHVATPEQAIDVAVEARHVRALDERNVAVVALRANQRVHRQHNEQRQQSRTAAREQQKQSTATSTADFGEKSTSFSASNNIFGVCLFGGFELWSFSELFFNFVFLFPV